MSMDEPLERKQRTLPTFHGLIFHRCRPADATEKYSDDTDA
jgi:hypothetical protein